MELDEMKSLWRGVDRRLQAIESGLRPNRPQLGLRFVRLVLWYEVAFGLLAVLLAGSYLADHIGELRFVVPALLLHLGAILILGSAVWQVQSLARIDYAEPVLEIQRRMAAMRLVRARTNRWLLLSTPLLWAVLVVVVPHGLIGLDVYRAFGFPWVLGNFGFGLAVLAFAAWASRRFPDARFLRALGDDLTGRKVTAAARALGQVTAFARESEAG